MRRAALQITQPSLSAQPKRSSQDEKAQSNKLRGGNAGVLCQRGSGWEGRTTRATRTSRTSRCTHREGREQVEGSGGEEGGRGRGREGRERRQGKRKEGGRGGKCRQAGVKGTLPITSGSNSCFLYSLLPVSLKANCLLNLFTRVDCYRT